MPVHRRLEQALRSLSPRRRAARLAADDAPAPGRDGAGRGRARRDREAARADARGRRRRSPPRPARTAGSRWWPRTTASAASPARSASSSGAARSAGCGRSAASAGATCAPPGSLRETGAAACRTRTSWTWPSTTSTWSASITGQEIVEVDGRSWTVAGQPVPTRPDRVRAADARGRHAGRLPRHVGGGARARDVLERRLGARRVAGPGDVDRGSAGGAPRHRRGRARSASAPRAVAARPAGARPARSAARRPAAPSTPATSPSAPPRTTCGRSPPCWRSRGRPKTRRPVRVEEIAA